LASEKATDACPEHSVETIHSIRLRYPTTHLSSAASQVPLRCANSGAEERPRDFFGMFVCLHSPQALETDGRVKVIGRPVRLSPKIAQTRWLRVPPRMVLSMANNGVLEKRLTGPLHDDRTRVRYGHYLISISVEIGHKCIAELCVRNCSWSFCARIVD
jgi:hypothetical protein